MIPKQTVHCMSNEIELGRLQQSVAQMEEDIKEIKATVKELAEFVAEQKAGRKYMWMAVSAVGVIVVFLKDGFTVIDNFLHIKH